MTTTKSVLVPLDGSALSDGVLKHVERLLGKEPYDVLLLRVVDLRRAEEVPGQAQLERDAAEAHLAATRARLEALGARVEVALREGDPAAEVLAAIEERRPTLVAMSSHGRTGVLRWVRGSVAERVLRESTSPLLIVTPRAADRNIEQRFRRVLVPLDGSERGAAILPLVEDLARRHGADVVLLRVEWEGGTRPLLAAALDPARVVESLRPFADRLARGGIVVRAIAAQGDYASEILDTAEREDADLVALTTHGKSGLLRLLDGSVSEQVLRHCRRPVLVLRTA